MRCSDFDVCWNEILDLRESPQDDPLLRAHLESCAACRDRHTGFELVCDILAGWPPAELSRTEGHRLECPLPQWDRELGDHELAERVLAELAGPRGGSRRVLSASRFRTRAARVGAMGVAAATLLAMYFSSGSQPGRRGCRHESR